MELWEILKRETPTCVDEINLALQSCIDVIENARVLLSDKTKKYMDLEKSQRAIELIKAREELLGIKNYIECVKCGDTSTARAIEKTPINIDVPIEDDTEQDEIDDEKYLVDQTIPYKLNEDFMNTKPCAFELKGVKYEVRNFKELLVKLCEILYRKDQRLFEKIAREHRIKCGEHGKVMICFRQDKAASELPKNKCAFILSSDILIYTGVNNPTKVYAIKELLSIYRITSFFVFLRWDKRIAKGQRPIGKLLNIDYDYSKEVVTPSKVKPEISVGQLAYDFFKEYFKDTKRQYDLKDFLDETWCTNVLGVPCPLFKEFNPDKNLKEQTIWGGKSYPSYAQNPKYQINGKTYLICMRWYEQYRDKLETWINKQDSTYLERVYSKKKLDDKDSLIDTEDNRSEKLDTGKKIGEYAREYFSEYFSDQEKHYDLSNFLNRYWCNEHLGICYPLLKEVDITKPIAEQKNYNNEYARYWTKPILQINGKHYIICSQWFRGFQEKLDNWIEEEMMRKTTEFRQQCLFPSIHQRNKEDCIHYDFKKDQCMCTQSDATFTLPCSNINSCRYFSPFALHIIPKQYCKKRRCPYCNSILNKELIQCTYRPDGKTEIHNKLISYRCETCDINYVADTVYNGYTRSKNLDDLNIAFIKENLV